MKTAKAIAVVMAVMLLCGCTAPAVSVVSSAPQVSSVPVSSEDLPSEQPSLPELSVEQSSQPSSDLAGPYEFAGDVYTTQNWVEFDNIDELRPFTFSFMLPAEWQRDGETATTFTKSYPDYDIKVMEILPVIQLAPDQSLPTFEDTVQDGEYGDSQQLVGEVKSGEVTTPDGASREYVMWAEISYPHGGVISVWYPYTCWLRVGSYAYGFAFYSVQQPAEVDTNYAFLESVLSTLEVKMQ